MCVRPNPRCFTSCLKYKRMPCFGFPHKCRWYDTIDANDLILLKESYYEGKGVSLAKNIWPQLPFCHQPCPFSQAGSVTPVLPLQGSMQTRSWVSLRPMRSYICTFDIINFNKNHCGGQSKSNIRGSLPFQISGKWDFVPPSFLCVCGGGGVS